MTDILGTELAEGHELFVYLGTAQASDNKTRALWIEAAELEQATAADYDAVRMAAKWYGKKRDTTGTIGGLYSIKVERTDDKTSLWFGTARFQGMSAHPLIPVFQAADAVERDREYRQKNAKKAQEPVYMRDMERTLMALKALPRRQALDVASAIGAELRRRILEAR